MTRTWLFVVGIAVFVLLAGITAGVLVTRSPAEDKGAASGSSLWPSETLTDWVTYGEYVVVLRPVSIRERRPSPSELENGEGLTTRSATLTVQDVVWSRSPRIHQQPETLTWTLVGSAFSDGKFKHRTPTFTPGESSVVMGHTYLAVIAMVPALCDAESRVDARWDALGTGSILPFDNDTVGEGEFEGANSSVDSIRRDPEVAASVLGRTVGYSADRLGQELAKTNASAYDSGFKRVSTCD